MIHLKFNEILNKSKEDNNFPQKYIIDLFKLFNPINLPIISESYLSSIKCYMPLPTEFVITNKHINNNKIIKNNNIYEFHGTKGNRIISSNTLLPFYNKKNIVSPLPFTFPIHTDDHIILIPSNIYFYEVTILNKQSSNDWEEQCISVGYGSKDIPFESHVGWYANSFGFHSDDGTFRFNQTAHSILNKSRPLNPGDTVGVGIIFLDDNNIKFFHTINEELIYEYDENYKITKPYFPVIGYDHPNSISVNFSTSKFKFNIKSLINEYSNHVISTNNDFMNNAESHKNVVSSGILINNINIIKDEKNYIKYNFINNIINSYIDINDNYIDYNKIYYSSGILIYSKHTVLSSNNHYDASGNHYDASGNHHYDASGNHYYDASGNHYDASGNHHYDASGNHYDTSVNHNHYDPSGNNIYNYGFYTPSGNFIYY
jgi:hypothetical protein